MGETPKIDAERLEKVTEKISTPAPRMRGVSPYKIPVWFKLVSYFKPEKAFSKSCMHEFVGCYRVIGKSGPFKKYVVLLNASQN